MNQFNLLELIKRFTLVLSAHGVESSKIEAEHIIAGSLGLKRLELYLYYNKLLSAQELVRSEEFLQRRCQREPLQYILEKITFSNLEFHLTPHCLIPRPETEQLVDLICQELKGENLKGKVLWDLCTGSGCIGISLKKYFPELTVYLSDISENALDCARQNAKRHDVEVILRHGDLFAPFGKNKADYIVANPPYIKADDYPLLQPEVRDFEPYEALVGGISGLEFYERFAREMGIFLRSPGKAFFELGKGQALQVKEFFSKNGFSKTKIVRDFDQVERFFFLESHSSS